MEERYEFHINAIDFMVFLFISPAVLIGSVWFFRGLIKKYKEKQDKQWI